MEKGLYLVKSSNSYILLDKPRKANIFSLTIFLSFAGTLKTLFSFNFLYLNFNSDVICN